MTTETQKPLLAFHGSQEIKDKYLARVRHHRTQDEIIKGRYWEPSQDGVFRGCAVGCTLHSNKHSAYEAELGIPVELAHLEDGIFESLPGNDHLSWPEDFLAAIPVGADLSKVWMQFIAWILVDEKYGVITLSDKTDVRAAVKGVADCYLREIAGEIVPAADWEAAGKDARVAWDAWVARDARDARVAWDARDARDARVAWVAWDAWVAWVAWDARVAWDAWVAWDARVAWDEYVRASAKNLLALLAGAGTPNRPALTRSAPSRKAPVRRARAGK